MRNIRLFLQIAVLSVLAVMPGISRADTSTLKGLVDNFADIIGNSVVTLLFGAALATFIFGVIRLIGAQGDANKREEAKRWLVWGIIGMFVLVGLWGIVAFLSSTFGIGLGGTVNPPGIYIQ